jgi:hypothetical protein
MFFCPSLKGVLVFTQGLSPFLRRLILSTLLDEERVMIHCQLTNSVPFNRSDARPGASFAHPRFGVGSCNVVLSMKLDETMGDVKDRLIGEFAVLSYLDAF